MHLQNSISSSRSVKIRIDGLFEFLVLIVTMAKILRSFRLIGSAEICQLQLSCLTEEAYHRIFILKEISGVI